MESFESPVLRAETQCVWCVCEPLDWPSLPTASEDTPWTLSDLVMTSGVWSCLF